MFETDDFDQILSQLDLPEPCNNTLPEIAENSIEDGSKCGTYSHSINICTETNKYNQKCSKELKENIEGTSNKTKNHNMIEEKHQTSPKHIKRRLINSYFNHKSKRKFPGPAGLLNGTFEDSAEGDDICQVELLSQDIDYTDSYLRKGIFESPLWARLLDDTKDINKVDSIKNIKHQALNGNLRHQKASTIRAYVEKVDRSVKDPLIVLRDVTDDIKCTLHRDAWVAFSPYIVSECCALVLRNPTVLTTGSAFKKHYLNITLSNIQSLYSSAVIKKEDESFPTGFVKVYEKDYTIIKNEKQNMGTPNCAIEFEDSNLLDGLDGAFSDDVFS